MRTWKYRKNTFILHLLEYSTQTNTMLYLDIQLCSIVVLDYPAIHILIYLCQKSTYSYNLYWYRTGTTIQHSIQKSINLSSVHRIGTYWKYVRTYVGWKHEAKKESILSNKSFHFSLFSSMYLPHSLLDRTVRTVPKWYSTVLCKYYKYKAIFKFKKNILQYCKLLKM